MALVLSMCTGKQRRAWRSAWLHGRMLTWWLLLPKSYCALRPTPEQCLEAGVLAWWPLTLTLALLHPDASCLQPVPCVHSLEDLG